MNERRPAQMDLRARLAAGEVPRLEGVGERLDRLSAVQSGVVGAVVGIGATGVVVWANHPVVTGVMGLVALPVGLALALGGEVRAVPVEGVAPARAPYPPASEVQVRAVADPVLGTMVQVPAVRFWMGSPEGEGEAREHPRHEVRLSSFAIGATPVTRSQWARVMGRGQEGAEPTGVSWFDALRFCNRASERAGLQRCYVEEGEDRWRWDRSADGYRLPTEAEWECACRAGTETPFWCSGDRLGEVAWFDDNSGGSVHPAGERAANPWGLFDVHGNVWEWAWDTYEEDAYQGRDSALDPVVDSVDNRPAVRVVRGGSFGNSSTNLRSAYRSWGGPSLVFVNRGFRCVRGSRPQP